MPPRARCARRRRWALRPTPPGSHRGPHLPQLRKEPELQRFGEIRPAAGAAGAALVADDAFDRLQMMKAPDLELVIQIDKALGQFVQLPLLLGVVVHAKPCARDLLARLIGFTEVAREVVLRNAVAAAAQEPQDLVIE